MQTELIDSKQFMLKPASFAIEFKAFSVVVNCKLKIFEIFRIRGFFNKFVFIHFSLHLLSDKLLNTKSDSNSRVQM